MDFFSFFYQLNLYGQNLYHHLKGWDNVLQEYVEANDQFPTIWLTTVISSLLVFWVYYYVLNHPRFNKFWNWFITMVILFVGIFLYSRGLVLADIAGVSQHPIDPALNVSRDSALLFGVYNGVLSSLFFFFFSIVGRSGSRNVKNSPFRSLIKRK